MTNLHDDSQNTPETILDELETIIEQDSLENNIPSSGSGISSDEQIEQLRAALARSQADYQNLLMRVERDKADMIHFLSAKMLLPLLTIGDNLERAIKLKEGIQDDAFVQGIRSVFSGFQKYLDSQGVSAFESIGQEVDPDRHDVMTEAPGISGKIVSEFEKGYMLGTKVLRHAKVIVGNGTV